MARQDLTPTTCPITGFPTDRVTITWTADIDDGSAFANTGKQIVLIRNTDAGNSTVVVTATADAAGRTVNLTTSNIAAGGFAHLGPFNAQLPGWNQTTGKVHLDASNNNVYFAVVTVP